MSWRRRCRWVRKWVGGRPQSPAALRPDGVPHLHVPRRTCRRDALSAPPAFPRNPLIPPPLAPIPLPCPLPCPCACPFSPRPPRRPPPTQRLEGELQRSYATKNFTLKNGLLEIEKAYRDYISSSPAVQSLWDEITLLLVGRVVADGEREGGREGGKCNTKHAKC